MDVELEKVVGLALVLEVGRSGAPGEVNLERHKRG